MKFNKLFFIFLLLISSQSKLMEKKSKIYGKLADQNQKQIVKNFFNAIEKKDLQEVEKLIPEIRKYELIDIIKEIKQLGGFVTPLDYAIENNDPKIVSLLLENGADPNYSPSNLPFVRACDKPEILRILLKNSNFKPNAKGNWDRTPLMFSLICGNDEEFTKKLIDLSADVKAKDKDRNTALHFALAKDKNIQNVKLLINAGADLFAKNNQGQTPLIYGYRSNGKSDTYIFLRDEIDKFLKDNKTEYIEVFDLCLSDKYLIESGLKIIKISEFCRYENKNTSNYVIVAPVKEKKELIPTEESIVTCLTQ